MSAQSATPVIPSTSLRQFAKRRRVEVDAAAAGARSGTGSGPASSVAGVDDEYYALKCKSIQNIELDMKVAMHKWQEGY